MGTGSAQKLGVSQAGNWKGLAEALSDDLQRLLLRIAWSCQKEVKQEKPITIRIVIIIKQIIIVIKMIVIIIPQMPQIVRPTKKSPLKQNPVKRWNILL